MQAVKCHLAVSYVWLILLSPHFPHKFYARVSLLIKKPSRRPPKKRRPYCLKKLMCRHDRANAKNDWCPEGRHLKTEPYHFFQIDLKIVQTSRRFIIANMHSKIRLDALENTEWWHLIFSNSNISLFIVHCCVDPQGKTQQKCNVNGELLGSSFGENASAKLHFFENTFVWTGPESGRSISTVCLNSGV